MSTAATATIDMEQIARAAAALDHSDLPRAIQDEAEQFLTAHAERWPTAMRDRLIAAGMKVQDDHLAWLVEQDVELVLLVIAALGSVPPPEAAGDWRRIRQHYGLVGNAALREALHDPAHPLCLAFHLWVMLRCNEDAGKPAGAPYSTAERWFMALRGVPLRRQPSAWKEWNAGGAYAALFKRWWSRRNKTMEVQP